MICWSAMPGASVGAAGAAAAAGVAAGTGAGRTAPPAVAAVMSAWTMRPCGPEPLMADRSMPDSRARRRARGEAKTRACPLLPAAGAGTGAEAAFGTVGAWLAAGFASVGFLAAELAAVGAGLGGADGAGAADRALLSSPSARSTAI